MLYENVSPDVFDLIAFRSQVKTMYFDVRNQLVIPDSKQCVTASHTLAFQTSRVDR